MYIMVLNNGQHFSSLANCTIYFVPDDMDEDQIKLDLKPDTPERIVPIRKFGPVPSEGDWNVAVGN